MTTYLCVSSTPGLDISCGVHFAQDKLVNLEVCSKPCPASAWASSFPPRRTVNPPSSSTQPEIQSTILITNFNGWPEEIQRIARPTSPSAMQYATLHHRPGQLDVQFSPSLRLGITSENHESHGRLRHQQLHGSGWTRSGIGCVCHELEVPHCCRSASVASVLLLHAW